LTETDPRPRKIDKEVSNIIVQLMEQNWFSKNFGPERIMSELRRQNISADRIPSQVQIQNKLSYHHRMIFNFNNEINPLQEKARLSVFTGEEALDQPFVFLYDVDDSNRIAPIICVHVSVLHLFLFGYVTVFYLPISCYSWICIQ
jgi:hypothetical protein